MRPMKRPQPKWWKNCIHKIIRLRNCFVIIMWNRIANCCRLDSAYSLLKNFDSCFIFWTTVPSLGRVFSIWREFIDGLRRKLSQSLVITGRHWSLPFWKTCENCGMTVLGSRSQSSMTGGKKWKLIKKKENKLKIYCNQLENCISDIRSSDYSRKESMSSASPETRNSPWRADKLCQRAQTSPPKADESCKWLCGLDAPVCVIAWCKTQLLPVCQEWIKRRKRCNDGLTSSRPLVGSSRYMIAGSVTSSRAIDNLFRSPPLRTTRKNKCSVTASFESF